MKKAKFVQANEIVKPGKTSWEYVGIEISRDKEKVTMLCVGGSDWEDITVEDFDLEKYKFKVTDKERVHHLFSVALNESKAHCINKETELLRARRNLRFHENKVKEYFGKAISIEQEQSF